MEKSDLSSDQGSSAEAALVNLKPLRNLAQNWDIDIASCLQDYLQELTQVGHLVPGSSLPDGIKSHLNTSTCDGSTNFAQAALLLQNSSSVYSRKVEYLYSLVNNALNELLASANKEKNQSSKKRESTSKLRKEMEDFDNFDSDLNFLLLDDVLPVDCGEGKIDLKPIQSDITSRLSGQTVLDSPSRVNTTRVSLDGLLESRLEQSYLDTGRNGSSHIVDSVTARALLGTLNTDEFDSFGGNFCLAGDLCDISPCGTLLMPGSKLLGKKSTFTSNPISHNDEIIKDIVIDESNAGTDLKEAMAEDDDYTTDHFGFDGGNDTVHDEEAMVSSQHQRQEDEALEMKFKENETKDESPILEQTLKDDPWRTMDPHNSSKSNNRPLRVGVTYSLPSQVSNPPSSYVTGSRTKKECKLKAGANNLERKSTRTLVFIAAQSFREVLTNDSIQNRKKEILDIIEKSCEDTKVPFDIDHHKTYCNFSKNNLAFGKEFLYISKATDEARKKERRLTRRLRTEKYAVSENAADIDNQFEEMHEDSPDDDDDGNGINFDLDDDNDYSVNNDVSNVNLNNFDAAFRDPNENENNQEGNEIGLTFEELCRAHLKEFSKGAEKYVVETKLSKRVDIWENKLLPILKEEEERPDFDIHVYGKRILDVAKRSLNAKRKTNDLDEETKNIVYFDSIPTNKNKHEISRYFLASLMLCNTENISFRNDNAGHVSKPETLQFEVNNFDLISPLESSTLFK